MDASGEKAARDHEVALLRHPLWCIALVVLLLNDHWLKGSGLVPSWLTGKLSDFAGLIVAPVVLASLLIHLKLFERAAARAIGVFSVVAIFAAVNLSSEFAGLLDALFARAGIRTRNWSDPTDLVALSMIPFAWRILGERVRRDIRNVDRIGVLVGAIACLATSVEHASSPAIGNATADEVVVTVQPLAVTLECEVVGEAAMNLSLDDFGPPVSFLLSSGEFRQIPGAIGELTGGDSAGRICGAALINVGPFLEPTLVAWRTFSDTTFGSAGSGPPQNGTVVMERIGETFLLVPGPEMLVMDAPWAQP